MLVSKNKLRVVVEGTNKAGILTGQAGRSAYWQGRQAGQQSIQAVNKADRQVNKADRQVNKADRLTKQSGLALTANIFVEATNRTITDNMIGGMHN
jgi:hypothetical protein